MPGTLQNAGLHLSLGHHIGHVSAGLLGGLISHSVPCHQHPQHFPHGRISYQKDFIAYGRDHANQISLLCRQFTESPQGFHSKAKKLMKNLFHLNIDPHVHQLRHQSTPWRGSWIFLLSVHPLKSPHLLDLLPVLDLPLTHKQCLQSQHKS